jgi:hypothetical protein
MLCDRKALVMPHNENGVFAVTGHKREGAATKPSSVTRSVAMCLRMERGGTSAKSLVCARELLHNGRLAR